MKFIRKNPLFATALIVCAVLVLGELAFIYERYAESRAAARRFDQRTLDLQAMAELAPPPKREIAAAIAADLEKAQKSLAAMQGELKGRGPVAERIRQAKVPAARTDAFFDLASFVEKIGAAADEQDVEVRSEAARFGFAAYANEGPLQDHIEPVFRQRQIAQYLLELLIEARPSAILSVRRERTVTKAEREARAAALANGETPPEVTTDSDEASPDYFVIDPRVTARVPGYLDTVAFRLVFTGQTSALRTWLNRLAAFELPVLVREVEVDTATAEESAANGSSEVAETGDAPAGAPAAASVVLAVDPTKAAAAKPAPAAATGPRASAPVPIVTKPISKFTVTLEYVELVAAPAAIEEPAVPNP